MRYNKNIIEFTNSALQRFNQLEACFCGFKKAQIADMIADIESTTMQVLKSSESMSSTHAAAVVLANERIAAGPVATQEQVHAR